MVTRVIAGRPGQPRNEVKIVGLELAAYNIEQAAGLGRKADRAQAALDQVQAKLDARAATKVKLGITDQELDDLKTALAP